MKFRAVSLLAALLPVAALGGKADVLAVDVAATGGRTYGFTVTVRHDDAGWDHYADRWEVLDTDGNVLGVRKLLHPHDNEQPFTRSLQDVVIPAGVEEVRLRAGDSVHGFGGRELTVQLPDAQ